MAARTLIPLSAHSAIGKIDEREYFRLYDQSLADPDRFWRSFIGEPHSSHVVLSSSVASTTSSSGSGMFCVKVQLG